MLTGADGQRGIGHHLPPAGQASGRAERRSALVRPALRTAIARLRGAEAMGSRWQGPARAAEHFIAEATMPHSLAGLLGSVRGLLLELSDGIGGEPPDAGLAGRTGELGAKGLHAAAVERVLDAKSNACKPAGLGVCPAAPAWQRAWGQLDLKLACGALGSLDHSVRSRRVASDSPPHSSPPGTRAAAAPVAQRVHRPGRRSQLGAAGAGVLQSAAQVVMLHHRRRRRCVAAAARLGPRAE